MVLLTILTPSYVTNTEHSAVRRVYFPSEHAQTFRGAVIQVSLCVADRRVVWTKAPQLIIVQHKGALRFPNAALQIFTSPNL